MSSTVAAMKRRDLKKGHDSSDLRRRRGETTINLRKQKKEQGLAKRRNTTAASLLPTAPLQDSNNNASKPGPRTYTVKDIPDLAKGLTSTAPAVRTDAARGLRKILSREGNPPVDEVIKAGAMPLLVQCLDDIDNTDLQFETAWALTNIASTSKTRVVVEHGAVPSLVRNLRHHNPELREQCAWCLGNIAGDCSELRDMVLKTDALQGLLLNITQPASASLLRNCVWAVSNFCRGKPQPDIASVMPAIPILAQLVGSDDNEVLVDTCWALSYLSDGDSERIQSVIDAGTVDSLTRLLGHESCHVVTPALRTLGNFVTGEDAQTQVVLDAGVLPLVEALLHHKKKNIRKEACWTLSNVAAGTPAQLAAVCQCQGVIPSVIELLEAGEWEVQKEANFVISNIATAGNVTHVREVVNMGAIPALCEMLDRADAKGVMVTLDALSSILRHDPAGSPWAAMVDESDGLDRLEQLQEHENSKVYEKAVYILETYFGCDSDVEDVDLAPTLSKGSGTYSFGFSGANQENIDSSAAGSTGELPAFGSSGQQFNFA
ncbi:unnamed protein product [Discosporangium mesarthrocarpum]